MPLRCRRSVGVARGETGAGCRRSIVSPDDAYRDVSHAAEPASSASPDAPAGAARNEAPSAATTHAAVIPTTRTFIQSSRCRPALQARGWKCVYSARR